MRSSYMPKMCRDLRIKQPFKIQKFTEKINSYFILRVVVVAVDVHSDDVS